MSRLTLVTLMTAAARCGDACMLVPVSAVPRPTLLSPADAAVLETFAVPRYLGAFGELALQLLLCGDAIRMAHLGCRTGFPDLAITERVPSAEVIGLDPSRAAIELARNKAAASGAALEYHVGQPFPTPLESRAYSHVLSLHPSLPAPERAGLFREMQRLLYPGGQAVVALPLRGSFQELDDLLREYALKHDLGDFGRALEAAAHHRPTPESLSEELEEAGFLDVDVSVRTISLDFDSGRALRDDPVTRLLIVPDLAAPFGPEWDLTEAMQYVFRAVERYWSEARFELTVNIGCASGRCG